MNNFIKLLDGVDVSSAFDELNNNPLWDTWTLRQDDPTSAHHDTRCIPFYMPSLITRETIHNDLDAFPTIFEKQCPRTMEAFDEVIDKVRWNTIGRVMVVDLKAGGSIDEHRDEGFYSEYYDRMHLVISSDEGNEFTCGDETVEMKAGEVWKFNHHLLHSVKNKSNTSRFHLIIDYTGE